MEKQEIINLIIKLLWITKGGNDFSVTFNRNSATVLDRDSSTSVALDVIINYENYRNVVNALNNSTSNFFLEKEQSSAGSNSQLNSEIAIQESSSQSSSFNIEEDSTNKKSNFSDNSGASESDDQENEVQSLDSVAQPLNYEENDDQVLDSSVQEQSTSNLQLNTAKLTIQESDAQNSSFDINKEANSSDVFVSVVQPLNQDQSNDIEKDLENEVQYLGSIVQPLNYEKSNESLQYDNPQSNEYSDSVEEVDELMPTKRNSGEIYQFKINKNFKASKKIQKNKTETRQVNKKNNESVTIKRVPSNLTESDSLPSVGEILGPSETSVVERNDVLAISSINSQESSTPPSDVLMDNQDVLAISSINSQEPSTPPSDVLMDNQNNSSTNLKQSNGSLPAALRVNNPESKKRKRINLLTLSSKKKGKGVKQYSSEADSDEDELVYDSEQSQMSDTLKNNFRNIRNSQLIVYGDRLFSKNSIEDLLTTKFSYIFNDNNVINFSPSSLPSYSANNIESLENYFKEWSLQYGQLNSTKARVKEKMLKMLYELRGAYLSLLVTLANGYEQKMGKLPTQKTLRGFVAEKIKSILNIDDRQERKYWRGTWRLIELLNITHCPASILIESDITVRYLMISENEKYDRFLKNLLDDSRASHETPIFDESLIQRLVYMILRSHGTAKSCDIMLTIIY